MWLYKQKVIEKLEDFGQDIFGFIYIIKDKETDKFYIGKKQIMSQTNVKLNKGELASLPIQRGRKPSKKKVIKESNWKDYWGSNKILLDEIKSKGKEKFSREILLLCSTKKELTYWEVYYQMKFDVLRVDSYNDSILGTYYRKDFI